MFIDDDENKTPYIIFGTPVWANGDSYEGNFVDDERSGYGVYTWANGECYRGDFEHNLMNGTGTFTWPGGRVYSGHFENGIIVRTEESDDAVADIPDTQPMA